MWLKNLKLLHFRNYLDKEFEFQNKKLLIIGNNGKGKTSILEAIYLLSFGKSFRGKKDINMINMSHDECYTAGTFGTHTDQELQIAVSIGKKKNIRINNKNINRITQLIGHINTIFFSEKDVDLVEQSPEIRRKFADTIFSQMDHKYLINLIKYKKVLENRNYYLKKDKQDINLLDSYNHNLVKYGSELIYNRMKYFKEFFTILQLLIEDYNISALKNIGAGYVNNIMNVSDAMESIPDIITIQDIFYKELKKSKRKEKIMRFTVIGPHRDDILFVRNEKLRFNDYSSAGERRLLATVLKIAEVNFLYTHQNDPPIVLMDDIFMELDRENSSLILDYINVSDNQFFITTTDESDYQGLHDTELIKL